jgi:hypothetical protein
MIKILNGKPGLKLLFGRVKQRGMLNFWGQKGLKPSGILGCCGSE